MCDYSGNGAVSYKVPNNPIFKRNDCLDFQVALQWIVRAEQQAHSLIMQEVHRGICGLDCPTSPGPDCNFKTDEINVHPLICEYWEVDGTEVCMGDCLTQRKWFGSQSYDTFSTDYFAWGGEGCHQGVGYQANGGAKFLDGVKPSDLTGFKRNTNPDNPDLPPKVLNLPTLKGPCPEVFKKDEPIVNRSVTAVFNCCEPPSAVDIQYAPH